MNHNDCYVGQYVYYLPAHTKGDFRHPDVERGFVTSKNDDYVFVRFDEDGLQSKACKVEDLG